MQMTKLQTAVVVARSEAALGQWLKTEGATTAFRAALAADGVNWQKYIATEVPTNVPSPSLSPPSTPTLKRDSKLPGGTGEDV